MKSREQLLRDYEESLFELLMDDVMELEGLAYAEENERLKNSLEFAIPEEVDRKCKELIINAFDRKEQCNAKNRLKRVLKTALIAALFTTILFTTAYAIVPEVREITKVFITQVYEKYTSIILKDAIEDYGVNDIGDYTLHFIPDGYELSGSGEDIFAQWYLYSNGTDWFDVSITNFETAMAYNVDTENAYYEEIKVGDYDGLFVEKDGQYQLVFGDAQKSILITIFSNGLDKKSLFKIARGIY